MKNHFEVFAHFCVFCIEVKTQFSASVCILRNDSAKGYMSYLFNPTSDNTIFSINHHVLIHLFKMELLRGRTSIFLIEPKHFCSNESS